MINIDNDNSTNAVTKDSKTISSIENNESIPSTVSKLNPTGEEQSVQHNDNDQINGVHENDQMNGVNENESQNNQLVVQEEQQLQGNNNHNDDDEFIRITAAHQMLTEAQTYDEQKNYPAALHLYRICVDLLLEELMFTEGTDQSRVYLRDKCTAIMDRVDVLKTMLDPIPPPTAELPPPSSTDETKATTTTTIADEQEVKPPTDELNSLNIS